MEMRIQGGHGCRGLANHNVVSGTRQKTSYNGAVRALYAQSLPKGAYEHARADITRGYEKKGEKAIYQG